MTAAAGALALNLTALMLAFGWRSLAQWRATGDTGLRLDAGRAGTLRWWAKVLFVAALVLGVHGAAYATYTARVGRFLPGVGRLTGPQR
jgi:hypothetical protein